ncbi:glycogen phosphorylase [Crocosphaera subtropica ATCC 51142]|uniref:Alpha-1,4 glucan phosphorylase n=1 Tax=Crocosphaera subtropica (strain ATCC 51142 / BH68) TaxID=43989 RepID=B1X321_CROS5|nr:glycogen/starch/alpha-glucan phosphorylase [Crocosphaera subtropica]ACB54532.1 glycogen phosphorylase [Crocosphaera subtropica ATCC 51142]
MVSQNPIKIEDDRTGLEIQTLRRAILDNLFYIQGKFPEIATKNDFYLALAYTIRDRLLQRWLNTMQTEIKNDVKKVCYLSAEFLVGPHLENNLINLGIAEKVKQAVTESGLNIKELIEAEEEPGLGNGGLGRLAACYMDSLSSLEVPAIGYGIRYEFGIFDQEIKDGWQVEITDKWLQYGNPWEIARPEASVTVNFGGYTEPYTDGHNQFHVRWVPGYVVKGIPYDTPITGYKVNTVNTMRLWRSEACESFDFQRFNVGDYYGAVDDKVNSENITKVLYPNDEQIEGKELRLRQQYFFVSCSLQDMIRIHLLNNPNLDNFHEQWAVQLNDTHPAVAVAELMRLLVDIYEYEWGKAWNIVEKTFAYTNHTLLPEALEKWPIEIFGNLLPRVLEVIYEINRRFLDQVRIKFPNDDGKISTLSIIDESGERYVRMAHLACIGSHHINGVAELHSQLVKDTILHDFYLLWPQKFTNVTNGVTPRRWMVQSNPRLSKLITSKIGDGWIKNLQELKQLERYAEDQTFRQQWREAKQFVKQDLANYIQEKVGITVNPESLFDVQVKRIHEYKRQHLNVLHIITLYKQMKSNPNLDVPPRTFIFGGKAAPGYFMAKRIIKFITAVGDVVNNDGDIGDRLKVIFLPDYNVTFGQRVYPAADLSEQISTAGKEASGTGNMKFSMNGALTIGTLDGANVEIRQEVGEENFFLFGLTTPEVLTLKDQGYVPRRYYHSIPELKGVLDLIASGFFSHGDPELFRSIVDNLLYDDPYLLLADYKSYIECQEKVSQAYKDQENWSKMSILNVARMGKFSSDRSIQDYCNNIWNTQPVSIELKDYVQKEAQLNVNES